MTLTRRIRAGWLRRSAVLGAVLALGLAATAPARAQFSLFGSREASPEDVSETIAEHGFRLVGPLFRNGRVYLADVLDRRQRRERLVISAESGEIVQRYFVDVGPERQPSVPRAAPRDESFFSHLTRGWDDGSPPRPPVGLSGPDDLPPVTPPAPRAVRPQPKVLTRTETGPMPVTATPLPPPGAAASAPATPAKPPAIDPEVVAVPSRRPDAASVAPASTTVRATSVSTDPLRIPGIRKPEEAKAAPVATVAKTADPAPAAVTAPPAPKPVAPAPVADVPVAPLD